MQKVEFNWEGRRHTIPAARAFEVGAAVEDVVSLVELTKLQEKLPLFKLSSALAVMINMSGGNVTRESVFAILKRDILEASKGKTEGDEVTPQAAQNAVMGLMSVLMNGAPEDVMGGNASEPGKPQK
jgi:hypothetical protein